MGEIKQARCASVAAMVGGMAGSAPISVAVVSESLAAPNSGFVVSVNAIPVSVIFMDREIPPDAWETAAKSSLTWPNASDVFAASRSHIVVAALSSSVSHSSALAGAVAVTMVAGALAKLLPIVGSIFAESNAVVEGSSIATMAEDFAQKREIPEILWVSLHFFRSEHLYSGVPLVGALTTGLFPFIGREIEFEPAALRPTEVAQRVFGLCQYLMLNGLVIKDGDTVGNTLEEKIIATFVSEGRRSGVPVLRLTTRPPLVSSNPEQPESRKSFGKRVG